MAMNTIPTLLDALERTQLFSPEQVEEVKTELVPHFADPVKLADYLVEIEWLTEYQVDMLFAEEWDHLVVGPYQILDLLGEGGISEVFKAWDTQAGRIVTLKALRPELASRGDAIGQLRHEIEVMTRLSHPNVIHTLGVSDPDEVPYYVMEHVEGMDLERFVQQHGRLPVEQACDYIRQAAQGLQHVHQLGLVHRDVKPANLFLVNPPVVGAPTAPRRSCNDPLIKILDWGLARICTPSEGAPQASPSAGAGAAQGHLLGTPDYVAPEQAQTPAAADIRADIYSLGCTLYYLLAGKPPFAGTSLMQKLMQHREEEPRSIQELRPDVPDDLAAILRRMMAKKPEDRFPIPLLLVAPLRRFSIGAAASPGQVFRPGSSPVLRPGSSPALVAGRPASAPSLPSARPPSFLGIGGRPGSSGQVR